MDRRGDICTTLKSTTHDSERYLQPHTAAVVSVRFLYRRPRTTAWHSVKQVTGRDRVTGQELSSGSEMARGQGPNILMVIFNSEHVVKNDVPRHFSPSL